jgi:GWxTD domain-containing protein
MIPAAILLIGLTGIQLGWTVTPASAEEPGSIRVDAVIEEGDLVFVSEAGEEAASFEMVASISDGGFARSGGSLTPDGLPSVQTLEIVGVTAGRHDMMLLVRDLESGRTVMRETSVEVPVRTAGSWSSSTLQLFGGNRRVSGEIGFSWQIFPPSGEDYPDSLQVAFLFRDNQGSASLEGWMEYAGDGVFEVQTPLEKVPAGDYDLMVAAVVGSEIVTGSVLSLEISENWDVWGNNPDITADLIRPIADGSELDALQSASTESERQAVMSEFWQKRDPTPMTQDNEFQIEYLHRLDVAADRFSFLSTRGIETDMGQVFALLGEPDIIDDMPFETGSVPYQVWTYFSPAVTIVFSDNLGCGVFDLETSWAEIRRAYERR